MSQEINVASQIIKEELVRTKKLLDFLALCYLVWINDKNIKNVLGLI